MDLEKINKVSLKNKKVVCTVHHIDESKFVGDELEKFYEMDDTLTFIIQYQKIQIFS